MDTHMIEARDLSKHYGSLHAVRGVSFEVKTGEIFGILGPNGAGKTTTLEMLEALRTIDGGSATVAGHDVAREPEAVKRAIGVQIQSAAFFDKVRLEELLSFALSVYHVRGVTPRELLDRVQLTDKARSYPEQLSGGQLQRFSIAMAIAHSPKLLFLDEPTTGLDPQARRNTWDLIRELREDGITILLTTHYMDEAELLCDRLAIMDNGSIIALDSPDALVQKLLDTGFSKTREVRPATLDGVFIQLTGKELRD